MENTLHMPLHLACYIFEESRTIIAARSTSVSNRKCTVLVLIAGNKITESPPEELLITAEMVKEFFILALLNSHWLGLSISK